MSFWKEFLEFITGLPKYPNALITLIGIIIGFTIIFIGIYTWLVDKITIKHIGLSIVAAIYFLFSIFWELHYINNPIKGLLPAEALLLLLVIKISISIIIRKRRIKQQTNAVIKEGTKGSEKVRTHIMIPETTETDTNIQKEE